MLASHTILYSIGYGTPALIMLWAVAVYTRLLGADEYGRYALVYAGAMLGNSLFFQWLRFGVLRFYPVFRHDRETFLSTVTACTMVLLLAAAGTGGVLGVFWPDQRMHRLILLATALCMLAGLFDLYRELARSQLRPLRFSLMSISREACALGASYLFIRWGFGAEGIVLGLLAAIALQVPWMIRQEWPYIRWDCVDVELLKELMHYGLPLASSFILSYLISTSDRFLLGYFLGTEAAGLYAAGYDLAGKSLLLGMMVINLSAFPLAIRALEDGGIPAARAQLQYNAAALLAVSLPATVALSLLAPNLIAIFLGASFRQEVTLLMPWIALGTLLCGLRIYYVDLSFYLSKKTAALVWVLLVGACSNVFLNMWLIPRCGLKGAAYGNVLAYLATLVVSWLVGRRAFPLPFPLFDAGKVIVASLLMGAVLWLIRAWQGLIALAVQAGAGLMVFALLLLAFDAFQVRHRLHARVTGSSRHGNTAGGCLEGAMCFQEDSHK